MHLSVDIGAHVVSCLHLSAPNTMAMVFDALGQANITDAITAESLKKQWALEIWPCTAMKK